MLSNSVESIGGGYGGFGGGGLGSGFIGGAVASLLFPNGVRRGYDGVDGGGYTPGYQAGVMAGESAKYRDVVSAENDINNNINQHFEATNASIYGVANAGRTSAEQILAAIQAQSMATKDIAYQGLIQFKELSAQVSAGNCEIKTAIHADGAATRALIEATNTQALRDKCNELERQRDLLATGNFPVTRPGTLVCCDPCKTSQSSDNINIINQNVNAIGSQVAQLASAVSALAAKAA